MKLAIGIVTMLGGIIICSIAYIQGDHTTFKWTLAGAITFEIGFNRYLLPALGQKNKEKTKEEDKRE